MFRAILSPILRKMISFHTKFYFKAFGLLAHSMT
ncbi:Hypothetical protein Minf_1302 [Methylacidiphilum infernorum V4]|uniref:Uncharacterized protein n=1 Tax=Methylacidiphilum infernorum (isolate V4) TaxID=481448 RepID=B3DVK3_METI4|nr:Hypothetical protein Minf_1302 [Methylacidiphilum infernorum V4]